MSSIRTPLSLCIVARSNLVIILGMLAACAAPSTMPPVFTLQPTIDKTDTPGPYPAYPVFSPVVPPTSAPTLAPTLILDATATTSPLLIIPTYPVLAHTRLECQPEAEFMHCVDDVLKIEFDHPVEWGTIDATLRVGGDAGLAYDYLFSEESMMAGGRSRDFVEGRGGWPTDYHGEDGPQRVITEFVYYPMGQVICDGLADLPIASIRINLPNNPTINGFTFVLPVLSNEAVTQWRAKQLEILGWAPESGSTNCSEASWAEFDLWAEQFRQSIESGETDMGTLANLEVIRRIADSVVFLP